MSKEIQELLNALEKSFKDINDWFDDDSGDIHIGELLSENYPFNKSFDEMYLDVVTWVRDTNITHDY